MVSLSSLPDWSGEGSLLNNIQENLAQEELRQWQVNKYAENSYLHNIGNISKEEELNKIRKKFIKVIEVLML